MIVHACAYIACGIVVAIATYTCISQLTFSYVRVEILSGELSEEAIKKFQVVVLTQSSLEEQRRIGECCHGNGMCFIVTSTRGLFG